MDKIAEINTPKIDNEAESIVVNFFYKNKAIILTILGVILTSIVYLAGFSFHSGKISEFGVYNEFFPRSSEYYLLQGFYVISWGLLSFLKYLVQFGWMIIIPLGISFFVFNLPKVPRINNWLVNKKVKQSSSYSLTSLILESIAFMFAILFIPILIISFFGLNYIVFAELSNKYGKETAQTIIESFKENQGCDLKKEKPYNCAFVYSDNDVMIKSGVIIATHEDKYLLWNGKVSQIYTINETNLKFKSGFDEK